MRRRVFRRPLAIFAITVLLTVMILGLAVSTSNAATAFPDVPSSSPYYTAITALSADGVIGGYADGTFGPALSVTRQQFAKMIVLTMGLSVRESDFPNAAAPFVDLGPDDASSLYPHEYVAVCAIRGITRGTETTRFSPLANITRSQLVTMVKRAGGSGATPPGYGSTGNAGRGEVAWMLYTLRNELRQGATTTTVAKVEELKIAAAASLKAAFTTLGAEFDKKYNSHTTFTFDASGTLQKQIEAGAEVDVFASAGSKQVNALVGKGLIPQSSVKNFTRNEIALVVPANSTLGLSSFMSLTSPNVKKIGYGDPAVAPNGVYAEEVMKALGIFTAVRPKVIYAANVAQATTWVLTGEVDAGMVYVSEAVTAGDGLKVVALAKSSWHSKITYPIGTLTLSKHKALAQKFIDFVLSAEGQAVLQSYGFLPLS